MSSVGTTDNNNGFKPVKKNIREALSHYHGKSYVENRFNGKGILCVLSLSLYCFLGVHRFKTLNLISFPWFPVYIDSLFFIQRSKSGNPVHHEAID